MGTCDKCKHWTPSTNCVSGSCFALDIHNRHLFDHEAWRDPITTVADFGCNRFEEKPTGPFVVNDESLYGDYVIYHQDNPCPIIASFERTPNGLFEAHERAQFLNKLWQERA